MSMNLPPDDFRPKGGSKFRQRLAMVGLARPQAEPPGPPAAPPMEEVVYFQFRHQGPPPGLAEVAARYGFREGELDAAFGVVPAGRDRHLYLVLARADARSRVAEALDPSSDPTAGFVSNDSMLP